MNPTDPNATDVTVTTPPQQVLVTNPDSWLSSRGAAEGPASPDHRHLSPDEYDDRSAPRGGIAPDLQARSGLTTHDPLSTTHLSLEDRGIFHASDAMKDLYDMGDSPSCATCGAIMTRSGSCYRCMSCGSTSGCS